MTQEYEPIEITESTPEPECDDTFLLDVHDDFGRGHFCGVIAINVEGGWMTTGSSKIFDWEQFRKAYVGWRIQSFAAHDTQIRAEAWGEGHARGWMDGVENAEPASPNPYRKENYLYKSNGLQREEQQ